MIADWTVEVGPDSAWIEVPWEGWVDLRPSVDEIQPARWDEPARSLPETQAYPELAKLLRLANGVHTVSSKVDVFPVCAGEVDPEIVEMGERETRFGLGSYLDVVPFRSCNLGGFEDFEALARSSAVRLDKIEMPGCCAEIVIRPARLDGEPTYGFTLYAMGFGPTGAEARERWGPTAISVAAALKREIERRVARVGSGAEQVANAGE